MEGERGLRGGERSPFLCCGGSSGGGARESHEGCRSRHRVCRPMRAGGCKAFTGYARELLAITPPIIVAYVVSPRSECVLVF